MTGSGALRRRCWRWRLIRKRIRKTQGQRDARTRRQHLSRLTNGVMVLPHVKMPRLLGAAKGHPFEPVPGEDHWHQFIDAARGEGKTTANFDYAGPLTEAVLLGSVAERFPKQTLDWDAAGLKFSKVRRRRINSCAAPIGPVGKYKES